VALAPALVAAVSWLLLRLLLEVGSLSPGSRAVIARGARAVEAAFPAVFAFVPVMLFIAVLKYRLWDLDIVLSRGLLLVLLTGTVGALYAVVLGATGWLFRDHVWTVAAAMTAAVLVAEPARRFCHRLANRLVFGQQLTPREAMRVLTDRLARSAPTSELSELTRVVVAGTRCTSAAVWVLVDDELLLSARHPAAAWSPDVLQVPAATVEECRSALRGAVCVPVVHEGALVAVLAVTVPHGVRLPEVEVRLLDELARHAGLLVANARLTQGLAHQLEVVAARGRELRASRREVVEAQDAERRALERDIHDGAQQELVALLLQMGMAQRRGAPSAAVIESLRASLARAVQTLRVVAAGRAAAVLADRGLVRALQDVAALARQGGPQVEVRCDVPRPLRSDVEATVYFCVREALQNATKHACATTVRIDVDAGPEAVTWAVTDDGVGMGDGSGRGAGLANLRERVTRQGGTLWVGPARSEATRAAGTLVRGRLPLTAPALAHDARSDG
jgi:signal transduction histidine kinase